MQRPVGLIKHNKQTSNSPASNTINNVHKPYIYIKEQPTKNIGSIARNTVSPKVSPVKRRRLFAEQVPLKKQYETGNKFFDIDYERISQIKQKYLDPNQIKVQSYQPPTSKYLSMPINYSFIEQLKPIRMEDQINYAEVEQPTYGKISPKTAKIRSQRISANRSTMEPQHAEQSKQFRFSNPVLNDYFNRMSNKENQIVEEQLIKSKIIDNRQMQIMEEELLKQQILERKLLSDHTAALESELECLKNQEKEHGRIKRAEDQKRVKELSEGQAMIREHEDQMVELNMFVHLLEQQIKYDIEFRKCREMIKKNQLETVTKIIQKINPAITKHHLTILNTEINPFEEKNRDKKLLQRDELISELIKTYEQAENYFSQYLHKKHDYETVKIWLNEIDIEKNGTISIGNIITDINMRAGTSYRNRDLVKLSSRINDKKEFTKQELLGVFVM